MMPGVLSSPSHYHRVTIGGQRKEEKEKEKEEEEEEEEEEERGRDVSILE